MSNTSTLKNGKPYRFIAGLAFCAMLVLLLAGTARTFMSQNEVSPNGTRVTLVSPTDRDYGVSLHGTRITVSSSGIDPDGDRD